MSKRLDQTPVLRGAARYPAAFVIIPHKLAVFLRSRLPHLTTGGSPRGKRLEMAATLSRQLMAQTVRQVQLLRFHSTAHIRTLCSTSTPARVSLGYLQPHEGRSVRVCGWVQSKREHGGITFLLLRDSFSSLQVTIDTAAAPPAVVDALASIRLEDAVEVTGALTPRQPKLVNPRMSNGTVELIAAELAVINSLGAALPISPNPQSGEQLAEETRLEHRDLDLRRPQMQRNLRLRSAVTQAVRSYLHQAPSPPFVEIDTPALFKSTPEGAREFLVPTRSRGRFYSLTQSPQQFKQVLAATAGFERYFQIARCFRDESGRADRQPEFSQIDMEVAHATPAEVIAITEGALAAAFGALNACCDVARGSAAELPQWLAHIHALRPWLAGDVHASAPLSRRLLPPLPLPRITYAHAMCTYGSDKPDRRPGMPIQHITSALGAALCASAAAGGRDAQAVLGSPRVQPFMRFATAAPPPRAVERPGLDATPTPTEHALDAVASTGALTARCFVAKTAEQGLSRKQFEAFSAALSATCTSSGGQDDNVAVLRVGPHGVWGGHPLAKLLPTDAAARLSNMVGAREGDTIVIAVGETVPVCSLLGSLRATAAKHQRNLSSETVDAFWVTDFPLFEKNSDAASIDSRPLVATHHPFTAPVSDDLAKLRQSLAACTSAADVRQHEPALLQVRGQHYDVVLNGWEVGGGSVRVHDAAFQEAIMTHLLQLPHEQVRGFQHLLASLRHGAMPHGGLALGLDRLICILAGEEHAPSLRDVIAFPKSAKGECRLAL